MSIQYDHHGVIYRATITRDALQDVVETWQVQSVPAGKNCRPNQAWSGTLQDPGPGQVGGTMRQWFLVKTFDCLVGDLIRITSGPETGAVLFVEEVTRPTNGMGVVQHLEANVRPYTGNLT